DLQRDGPRRALRAGPPAHRRTRPRALVRRPSGRARRGIDARGLASDRASVSLVAIAKRAGPATFLRASASGEERMGEDAPGRHAGTPAPSDADAPLGRRAVLKAGAALSALAGGIFVPSRGSAESGANLPPNVPAWTKEQGAPILSPPYGQPSEYEKHVVRRYREVRATNTAATTFSPLQDLYGIVTPNGLCFERHHGGVPKIDPGEHRLVVHGMVERPLVFTMDDLMRLPSVSRIHFLECSGNTQNWKNVKPEFTVQQTHGLVMCC